MVRSNSSQIIWWIFHTKDSIVILFILTHWFRSVQRCTLLAFRSKFQRVPFKIIFPVNDLNRQKSIFFRLVLLLKPYNQPVGHDRQKTQGRFDQKKFFLTFLCWDDLRVFFKMKKIFFQKIFFEVFLKKNFFLNFF